MSLEDSAEYRTALRELTGQLFDRIPDAQPVLTDEGRSLIVAREGDNPMDRRSGFAEYVQDLFAGGW